MKIRKPYGARERVAFECQGLSLTKQVFKDECDVNRIMKRFEKTGLVEHLNRHQGDYGDFVNAPDYHSALNAVRLADDMFMSLPAKLRQRFSNDPAEFLAFVDDPENADELIDLGLAKARAQGRSSEASTVAEGDGGEPSEPEPKAEASGDK